MARSKAGSTITPETKATLSSGATVATPSAITIGGLDAAGAAAKTQSERERERLHNLFVRNGNPASFIQQIRPKQSAASAYSEFIGWSIEDMSLYDLLDEMNDKDQAIGGAEGTFAAQVIGRPHVFEIDTDGDEDYEGVIREFLKRHLFNLGGKNGWLAALRTTLTFARRHGFSVSEVLWGEVQDKDIGTAYVPRAIVHRHPGQFEFDTAGTLLYRPFDSAWKSAGIAVVAPPCKFITHVNGGHYGSPFGDSEVFPLRWLYWLKKDVLMNWVNTTAVNGQPILVATTGSDTTEGEKRYKLEEALKALTANSVLILGEGDSLTSIARGVMNGVTPHERLFDKLDEIAVRFLTGSTLGTMENNGSGSLSQALAHLKVADEKRNPTAADLAATITRDLVGPVVALNFGPDVKVQFVIDTEETRDVEAAIKVYDAAARARIPVSKKQFRKDMGLEAPTDEEDELLPPVPQKPEPPQPEDETGKRQDVRDPEKRTPKKLCDGHRANVVKFDDRTANRARSRELRYSRLLEMIASDLANASSGEVLGKLKSALSVLRKEYAKDAKLTGAAADAFKLDGLFEGLKEGVTSARALGMLNILEAVEKKKGGWTEVDPKDLGADYRDAVDWMLKRDIMERDEVRRLAGAIADRTKDMTAEQIERELRSEILALAKAPNLEVTKRVSGLIGSAVENGTTVGEFLEAMDELVDAGTLPAGLDSYLNTVYNTEVNNAYGKQREAILADPDLAGLIWGKMFLNPNDQDSRDTHAALDGVKVKLGSAADLASKPGPPFSYNCRCTWVTILDEDTETPGALSKIMSIERF